MRARSSSKTRARRLDGFSGEKEVQRNGRRGIRVRKRRSFDMAVEFGFLGEQSVRGLEFTVRLESENGEVGEFWEIC